MRPGIFAWGLLVLAAGALLGIALASPAAEPTQPEASVSSEPVRALAVEDGIARELAALTARVAALEATRPPESAEPPTRAQPTAPAPRADGWKGSRPPRTIAELRRESDRGSYDARGSEQVREALLDGFAELEIEADLLDAHCTASLCRTEIAFDDLEDRQRLAALLPEFVVGDREFTFDYSDVDPLRTVIYLSSSHGG